MSSFGVNNVLNQIVKFGSEYYIKKGTIGLVLIFEIRAILGEKAKFIMFHFSRDPSSNNTLLSNLCPNF